MVLEIERVFGDIQRTREHNMVLESVIERILFCVRFIRQDSATVVNRQTTISEDISWTLSRH